ncbi:MAG TPA: bifunctional DNA-formamidopyrimidine glycosylase/DNA-(apurinic or apyrimidinic site) lyase, partial [Thermoanaerobaculia bacterium]|nr:bifunctional DNA-formamidopyrimidine glycosylase/DNA-(apurinic or apyrimidinic site) lyase [Thermoanaerobaculia bacterium]
EALAGRRIGSVARRAKNIVMDTGGEFLLVNLGMTGRLFIVQEGSASITHPGVRFRLADGRELLYHDVRRFGRLWRMSPGEWRAWEGKLGVEPLSDDFSAKWLYEATRRSRVAVKVWLMDQKRVVGVGNIYASEALFRAGVHPERSVARLSPARWQRLAESLVAVLAQAIAEGGTTLNDFADGEGNAGEFQVSLGVYGREGEECPRCGRPVRRRVQAGRSTFYCPACQR